MSEPNGGSHRPPTWVLGLAGVLAAGAIWWMLRSNTSPAVRECLRLYAEASTAADSLAVDSTVTAAATQLDDPHSCGFLRQSSRWQ